MDESEHRQAQVQQALASADLQAARGYVFNWLHDWASSLSAHPERAELRQPKLWSCLADVVERTSDHYLIERLWQLLEQVQPATPGQQRPAPTWHPDSQSG